jgi:hypothetical protein
MCDSSSHQLETQASPAFTETFDQDRRRFEVAGIVAEQIWREQELTSKRLNWNLTLQGFLLAAFAFAFGERTHPNAIFVIEITLTIAGISVAFLTLLSVMASQAQRDYMKRVWRDLFNITNDSEINSNQILTVYPRPYSVNRYSKRARFAIQAFLAVMIVLWATLFILSIGVNFEWPIFV